MCGTSAARPPRGSGPPRTPAPSSSASQTRPSLPAATPPALSVSTPHEPARRGAPGGRRPVAGARCLGRCSGRRPGTVSLALAVPPAGAMLVIPAGPSPCRGQPSRPLLAVTGEAAGGTPAGSFGAGRGQSILQVPEVSDG